MKTKQITIKKNGSPDEQIKKLKEINPHFVLCFGAADTFAPGGAVESVAKAFPEAVVVGCSTAGEINNDGVDDNTLVVTGANFKNSKAKAVTANIKNIDDSAEAGKKLASQIDKNGLKAVFVLCRGLDINGSAVIEGMRSSLGSDVVITGGLAGDGGKFQKTFTLLNGTVSHENLVAVGFYGDIKVGYGYMGGWEPFGPVRKVTKAQGSILMELDGEPALDLYKKYLGDEAKNLPASGLLYPFAVLKDNQDESGIIRTILGVDEKTKSLVLAGDIHQGGIVRLMHTDNSGLVKGASGAADKSVLKGSDESFGVLISCVGRKLVMGSDVADEIDAVRDRYGKAILTGFYSYGEICPTSGQTDCKLHNQTMTITHFTE